MIRRFLINWALPVSAGVPLALAIVAWRLLSVSHL
jgi:hypothetical protein